jgi:TPP-dependent 2-oxoacid decarboxylase
MTGRERMDDIKRWSYPQIMQALEVLNAERRRDEKQAKRLKEEQQERSRRR